MEKILNEFIEGLSVVHEVWGHGESGFTIHARKEFYTRSDAVKYLEELKQAWKQEMSDTPLCDEMLDGWVSEVNGPSKANFIAFARSLERKLRVAEEALDNITKLRSWMINEIHAKARAALDVIREKP